MDGMNAEGLAVGHSSVGSIFQQSAHHVPILLWAYEGMMHSRTTGDFTRHMAKLPTYGKGFSVVCVDRQGRTCSIEPPCPLIQILRGTEIWARVRIMRAAPNVGVPRFTKAL